MLNHFQCAKGVDGNIIAIMNIADGVAPAMIGTLGTAFEPRIVDNDLDLSRPDDKLRAGLVYQIDKQLLVVLTSRTVEDFENEREKIFPKYVRSIRALSDTIRNFVPDEEFDALSDKAIDNFLEDFEKARGKVMINALIDQAQFTLWTLRRLKALGQAIDAAGKPPEESSGADAALHRDYRLYSLWAQFHVDLSLNALHAKIRIPEVVQHAICDGLRAAVNAYAIGEEAFALRAPAQPPEEQAAYAWDEEDDELLASSMRDLDAETEL